MEHPSWEFNAAFPFIQTASGNPHRTLADDFTVPAKSFWNITEVNAFGLFNSHTDSYSVLTWTVNIYSNNPSGITIAGGLPAPGSIIYSVNFTRIQSIGDLTFVFPAPLTLGAGTYWLEFYPSFNLTSFVAGGPNWLVQLRNSTISGLRGNVLNARDVTGFVNVPVPQSVYMNQWVPSNYSAFQGIFEGSYDLTFQIKGFSSTSPTATTTISSSCLVTFSYVLLLFLFFSIL